MRPRDIVLLSTADWDNPFWTNKQHVALQLARRGHRVLYIESLGLRRPSVSTQDARRILRRLRRALAAPRPVRDNLWVWSPVTLPLHQHAWVRDLNRFLLSRMLKDRLRRLGFRSDILWTYNPLTTRFLPLEDFGQVVYHCVDEIRVQPGMRGETFGPAEEELVRRSDVVFATSPRLTETRRVWNANTHYFPNVADFEHFSKALDPLTKAPEDLSGVPSPRVGFVGAISGYKVDFTLLRFVAEQRPHWSVVLIGKIGEGDPWTDDALLRGVPNLHLLGPRPYDQLPGYLKALDVALLPNTMNEYTESMFPMKFFEYLAAGKPIVSVDLPALRGYAHVFRVARSYADFVKGIEEVLQGSIPPLDQRLAVAREHTYEARTEKMMQLVEADSCKLPTRTG